MKQEDQLEGWRIRAQAAWSVLVQWIWGARWDHSQPALDYSRQSLVLLSEWLMMAARGEAAAVLDDVVAPAGQYFGEVVLEHARADWEWQPGGLIGLGVELASGEVRHVNVVEVLEAWVAAARRGKEREVLVEHFDRAVAGALPPVRSA
jgi:hypothetical protein